MSLTKAAIVEQIYAQLDIQRNEAADILKSLLEIFKTALEPGEDVCG